MSNEICLTDVPLAIYQEKERNNIFEQDNERANLSGSTVLEDVTYNGTISPTKNLNKIRRSASMAAPLEYDKEVNNDLADCRDDNYEAGTMNAGVSACGLGNQSVETTTLITEGSCAPEFCEVPFSHGWKEIKPFDWEGNWKTPTLCAEKLYNYGDSQAIRDFHNMYRAHFSEWMIYNYEMNLLNELMVRAESNSSEGHRANGSVASQYKFHGQPKGYLSITHLKSWLVHLKQRGALPDGKLRVKGPIEEFVRAIEDYECNVLDKQICSVTRNDIRYEDAQGKIKVREMLEYQGICFYNDPFPRKAIWLETGGVGRLKYIYPFKDSVENADVGIMREPNPDYYKEWVYCNGQYHDLITIYEFIKEGAAERWTLQSPFNPEERSYDTGLDINVAKGNDVPCNLKRTMWFLWSSPKMRHRVNDPDHIGFHLALSRAEDGNSGYISTKSCTPPTLDNGCGTDTYPQDFDKCEKDSDCSDCNADTACEPVTAVLSPSGKAKYFYEGDFAEGTGQIETVLGVRLSGIPCEDGTIDFEFADDTAVNGTNYEGVSGTLNVEAGSPQDLEIPITILGVEPDADPAVVAEVLATLELTAATGGIELGAEGLTVDICIYDNTSECEECGEVESGCGCQEATTAVS